MRWRRSRRAIFRRRSLRSLRRARSIAKRGSMRARRGSRRQWPRPSTPLTTRNCSVSRASAAMPWGGRRRSTAARPISISRDSRSASFIRGAFSPGSTNWKAATETIAEELRAVMAAERAELVPYIQYDEHLPLAQWKPLNRNPDWTAIHLWRNGERVEANARHCPADLAAARRISAARNPGLRPQRHVFAACAGNRDPAACRGEQCAARLPPAADRARRLLVPRRRRDPLLAAGRGLRLRRHDRA